MPILYLIKPFIEILILWLVIYRVMLFFEGTRAVQVLRGITILICLFFIAQRLNLQILDWLLTKLFGISVIAILVIFHPEIRQGLAKLGTRHLFGVVLKQEEVDSLIKEVIDAAEVLSKEKKGAIIAIENNDSLQSYTESGSIIDSKVTSEIIQNIFTPNSLLHDGGIIIQNGRILAASCLFPLTEHHDINRIFGTRHRAALGLSEETDAVILVVSEERQDISLVYKGRIHRDLSKDQLFSMIKENISLKK